MSYLPDTCVLSEYIIHLPDIHMIEWLNFIEEEELFISVITIGEIQRGIKRWPDSHSKTFDSFMRNIEIH